MSDKKQKTVNALVIADVHCRSSELHPIYRLYVNNELFTERTWIWDNCYLEELIPISAGPGDYLIRYQIIPDSGASLKIKNLRIAETNGSAQLIKNTLRIR